MATSLLQPQIIHPVGDWFFGQRLPEFKVNWRDNHQIHHLEIIGRHLSCREHDDPSLAGIIHLPTPDNHYDLSCLEFSTHWPQLFISGPEFLGLQGQPRPFFTGTKVVARIDAPSNKLEKARMHVLATMTSYLADYLCQNYQELGLEPAFLPQLAARTIEKTPKLGLSRQPDGRDTSLRLEVGYVGIRPQANKPLLKIIKRWKIDPTWHQAIDLPSDSPEISL